jgi:hypothetical protein
MRAGETSGMLSNDTARRAVRNRAFLREEGGTLTGCTEAVLSLPVSELCCLVQTPNGMDPVRLGGLVFVEELEISMNTRQTGQRKIWRTSLGLGTRPANHDFRLIRTGACYRPHDMRN